jgi:hypothetical protein
MDCKREGKVKVKREEEMEKDDGEEREQEGHVLFGYIWHLVTAKIPTAIRCAQKLCSSGLPQKDSCLAFWQRDHQISE